MEIWDNPFGSDSILHEKELTTAAVRIGERIRNCRLVEGLSLSELGKMVGLSADRIQKYENGQRKPKPEMLDKIAKALDVSIDALEDPIIDTRMGAMYALFAMEDNYGLKIKEIDGEIYFHFHGMNSALMNDMVVEWYKERQYYEYGLALATSDKERIELEREYKEWKNRFPADIVERSNAELMERLKKSLVRMEQEEKGKNDHNSDDGANN